MVLRLAEFCAGTGAFSLGMKHPDVKLVYANDYDKNSKKIFDLNFGISLDCQDIHALRVEDIPPMDILTAGFPCQPYSLAGKKLGFADDRSNVFWKLIEIIKFHDPGYVVIENVKNLLTHDNSKTFAVIQGAIQDLGYHTKHGILNTSKITSIPHNRERLYIVCFKDIKKRDAFEFPEETPDKLGIKDMLEPTVDAKYYYSDKYKIWNTLRESIVSEDIVYQYRRTMVRENKSGVYPCLTANMGTGGHNVPIIKDTNGIRKITPRETFNLQGFPPEYRIDCLKDAALYKLAGNAVSVPVIKRIFEQMLISL